MSDIKLNSVVLNDNSVVISGEQHENIMLVLAELLKDNTNDDVVGSNVYEIINTFLIIEGIIPANCFYTSISRSSHYSSDHIVRFHINEKNNHS